MQKVFIDKKKIEKETNYAAIESIRNLFRLKKENKAIKDTIIRDIKNFFEHEEEDYYKPVELDKAWSSNFIKCKSKGNGKTLSVKEYINKIKTIPNIYHKTISKNLKCRKIN